MPGMTTWWHFEPYRSSTSSTPLYRNSRLGTSTSPRLWSACWARRLHCACGSTTHPWKGTATGVVVSRTKEDSIHGWITPSINALKAGDMVLALPGFAESIEALVDAGASTGVLACTELPLIGARLQCPLPCICFISTIDTLALAAIKWSGHDARPHRNFSTISNITEEVSRWHVELMVWGVCRLCHALQAGR